MQSKATLSLKLRGSGYILHWPLTKPTLCQFRKWLIWKVRVLVVTGGAKESGAIFKWRIRIVSKFDQLFRIVRSFFCSPLRQYWRKNGVRTWKNAPAAKARDAYVIFFSALSNEVVPSALTRVPRGHLWLEGDNAAASVDSRHFGPAPAGLVEGKARLAVFPYDDGSFPEEHGNSYNSNSGKKEREGRPPQKRTTLSFHDWAALAASFM